MSIKLVAIDIDGTLINDQHTINPEVKTAIHEARQKGVHIVLCTGRPLPGVTTKLAELAINRDNEYVITYNGSLIQNVASGDIVASYGMSLADYNILELTARRLGIHFHAINHETIFTPNRNISKYTVNEAYLVDMPLEYRTPEEMHEDLNIIKMMMIDHPHILDEAIKKMPQEITEKYNTVKSSPFYYELLNKNASKGNALKTLAEYLGLKPEETMAIGDNENDNSMLEYAGIGVAVANAVPSTKAAADVHVASNNDSGVAEALNKYVLI
ncbi:sugar-phosphatase [Enterococcus sp. HY326]|uniref:sugar-phosphatase n=1 Tax=Enterococcus sp. HY326 TaxID=2971265 RepID=UPI0022409565|nr:sugar-phosphatase [Enterococcus sp. HY326]